MFLHVLEEDQFSVLAADVFRRPHEEDVATAGSLSLQLPRLGLLLHVLRQRVDAVVPDQIRSVVLDDSFTTLRLTLLNMTSLQTYSIMAVSLLPQMPLKQLGENFLTKCNEYITGGWYLVPYELSMLGTS